MLFRSLLVARLVLGLVIGGLSVALARAQTPARLVVRLYNTAGVSTTELLSARRSAEHLLRGAGLDVVVRLCGRSSSPADPVSPCDTPLLPAEVVVRLIEAPSRSVVSTLPDDTYGVEHR